MTTRTRLTLSTLIGLLSLLGLSVTFYLVLPTLADELLRRKAEDRLEEGAARLPEALRELAEPARRALAGLTHDEDLARLVEPSPEHAPLAPWDLARELCTRTGLSRLMLLDGSGTLLSLHPDAARVGLTDARALALARAAVSGPVFVPGDPDNADAPAMLAVAGSLLENRVLALTFWPIQRTDIARAAARFGATIRQVSAGDETGTPGEPDTRIVHLTGAEAQRVLSVTLEREDDTGGVIQGLLVRGIVLLALPWLLGAAFLLIWVGWPSKERNHA